MNRLFVSAVVVAFLAVLNPVLARADSILLYHVVGTITITGNNTCSPAPCRELIDFAFDFGYRDRVITFTPPVFPPIIIPYIPFVANLETNWVGPLGTFTSFIPGPRDFNDSTLPPYVGMNGTFGDEVDFDEFDGNRTIGSGQPPTILPPILFSELYWCSSDVCRADFLSSSNQSPFHLDAPMTKTFTAIPEPSTLVLLGFGIAGIGTMKLRRRIRN